MKICKRFSECYPNSNRQYIPVYCSIRGSVCRDYEEEVESKPRVVEHIHRHSDMGRKEFDLLQQTSLDVKNLRKKTNELLVKKKRIDTI